MAIVIEQTGTGDSGASNTTNHSCSLPGGLTTGNVLVLVSGRDNGNVVSMDSGWTELAQPNNLLSVFTHTVDGSTGSTFDFTLSAAERGTFCVYELSGCDESDIEASTGATGSGTNPDADSVTHSGGSDDMLFIACLGMGRGDRTITGWPTGYTTQIEQAVGGGAGAHSAMASKAATAATDDPSAWAVSSINWGACTVCVKPSGGGGGGLSIPVAMRTYRNFRA